MRRTEPVTAIHPSTDDSQLSRQFDTGQTRTHLGAAGGAKFGTRMAISFADLQIVGQTDLPGERKKKDVDSVPSLSA